MQKKMHTIFQASDYLQTKIDYVPEIAIILGSGLGMLAEQIENRTTIPYHEIPFFPVSTVEGHAGQLVCGTLEGKKVIAMQGRFHYYEGYDIDQVVFPIRVIRALGTKNLIVTNACGSVNTTFQPGDLMIIRDHINFSNPNPLIGPNLSDLGVRFPDMSEPYSKELIALAKEVGVHNQINLKEGVYFWYSGPSYETPAEIRMIRTLGADTVGMSTVPEVIVAKHGGMKVLGISCITNMASGILDQPLSHQEVVETADKIKETFIKLVKGIINRL